MSLFSSTSALYGVGGFVVAWRFYRWYRERKANPNGLPLPPGPKGRPFIDNLLDFPTYKAWLVYDEWTKLYGDIVYFKVLGQPFLLLGSSVTTSNIFEKRSSNYSDRARMPMLCELMGWDWSFALMPYGPRWKHYRRIFHEHFQQNVVHKYNNIHVDATRAFLQRLLEAPEDFIQHTRHLFAATILKITYGIDIQEKDDPFVNAAEVINRSLAEAGNPGSFLVDLFPAMKHIPDWFPGAQWKKKAAYWRRMNDRFVNEPWDLVKRQIEEGTAPPSIARTMIENLSDRVPPEREAAEEASRSACAAGFAGGSDTIVSTVHSFFLAMCLYPEVQKKAQTELDMVLGGRLPEFNDKESLPYITAMVKESLRWQQVAPLGVPHMATEADEYNGYYIPKGTIVIGNAWTILHDPEVYSHPFEYKPDRFLTKEGKLNTRVPDPGSLAAFGFGRRVCLGRFLTENSMFILFAHILAVYDIRPGLSRNGREVIIKPEMTSGMLSYPEPFKCRITPRSKQAEYLVQNSTLLLMD